MTIQKIISAFIFASGIGVFVLFLLNSQTTGTFEIVLFAIVLSVIIAFRSNTNPKLIFFIFGYKHKLIITRDQMRMYHKRYPHSKFQFTDVSPNKVELLFKNRDDWLKARLFL